MAKRSRDLPIPEPAVVDLEAMELARIWMTGGTQVVSLRVGVPDPAAWGYTLADLAHHVALAYQRKSGLDPRTTMRAIRDAFLGEVEGEEPPDEPTGQVALPGSGVARARPDARTMRVELPPTIEHVTSATGVIEGGAGRAPTPRNRTPKPRRQSSRAQTKPR